MRAKALLIPHGIYQKYEASFPGVRVGYGFSDQELVIGFVGGLDPYKNIHLLIEAFYRSGIQGRLLLAGKCREDYRNRLQALIKDDRVTMDNRFIPDEEMSRILQTLDAAVLPYSHTSLNSGVMINAFSNGTTVIGTDIGMLQDFPEELVYRYHYTDEADHIRALSEALRRAQDDHRGGRLREKGERLEAIVREQNDWMRVKTALRQAVDGRETCGNT